jgi:hypothetical protein
MSERYLRNGVPEELRISSGNNCGRVDQAEMQASYLIKSCYRFQKPPSRGFYFLIYLTSYSLIT